MSDSFNHFHYLDKKLVAEAPNDLVSFNWQDFLQIRKSQFTKFQFVVSKGKEILYSEIKEEVKSGEYGLYILLEKPTNLYWIKLHDFYTSSNDMLYLNTNITVVHEDIGLQKSTQNMQVISHGHNEYYYLNKQLHSQLFLNSIHFELTQYLKCFSINLNNNQKQKNSFHYLLESGSKLDLKSLSCIQEGQMLDDSIECTHGSQSESNILYESLNAGKITTQVNSIIGYYAKDCKTIQNLKHIALNKNVTINSKPNLMIENPNVVASHGSSTGSFSEHDLFYLGQRGLNKQQSINVLSKSKISKFISETSLEKELSKYIGIDND